VNQVNLRIPGPTPCPQEVLQAVGRQMINHRGPEFAEMLARVVDRVKQVYQTKNDVALFTSGGTGAMEALVINTLSPGDRVLAVSIGSFGDRLATIAETYGANVTRLNFEWGKAADPAEIDKALSADRNIKAVLVTHNETSTGVCNDLESIAKTVRKHGDALILVDGISSVSSVPVLVDKWDLDAVASGCQKGWMVPPGVTMMSISPRAWKAYEQSKMPRFYFDARRAVDMAQKGQTPWTPAVSIFFGLDASLGMLMKEGLENVFERHRRCGDAARQGAKSLGLQLFGDERYASNTVTAIKVPDGIDGRDLNKMLREEYATVVGGGQQHLAGKIFRIGHLGWVRESDIEAVIEVVGKALPRLGFSPSRAAAS
jgi:aspartate aminotransferase-like enzyme